MGPDALVCGEKKLEIPKVEGEEQEKEKTTEETDIM